MKQETMGWQWHQLDHVQIICTSLQTDNQDTTSSLNWMLFLMPNQQRQSTEGIQITTSAKQTVNYTVSQNGDTLLANSSHSLVLTHRL